jgi:alkylation response protein AidB-like acyl-CoA dehydrogenase
MRLAPNEEQEALREAARAFLAEWSSSAAVRRAMGGELGFEPETWKHIAGELGWTGVAIPEAYGGAGLGLVELAMLLEPMGEALLCAPFLSTVCLAAPVLLEAGSEAQRREHLGAIAEGRLVAALAWTEAGGRWDAEGIETQARRAGSEWVLAGEKRFVLDGHCADLLVVPARRAGSRGAEGVSLFAVPAGAPGVERRAHVTMDATRRLADVTLRDVRLPADALLGEEGEGMAPLERAFERACVALAAEQTGGAQRCLDLAVAHARERVQFGRPIGSFQAIQHRCADMMVAVESARSAAWYAACAVAEGHADLAEVASLAKAWCSEAYFGCAAAALQVHGGVGFTWEYDVHLHLKRARAMESFLGSPAFHRERVAGRIGLGG